MEAPLHQAGTLCGLLNQFLFRQLPPKLGPRKGCTAGQCDVLVRTLLPVGQQARSLTALEMTETGA